MKVCDIVQFYSPLSGGVKRYVHTKMRYCALERNAQQILIVPSDRDRVTTHNRTRVYELRSLPMPGSASYRMLLAKSGIERIVESERPDLLEVGDPYRSAWIALDCARKYDIPVISFYHSDYPRALTDSLRKLHWASALEPVSIGIERYLASLYNRADATITPSRHSRRILEGLGVKRLVHVPLGVDGDDFVPNGSREKVRLQLGLSPGSRLLLYVGRLAREKNIHQLIEMMDILAGSDFPVHLLIVGDGELGGEVRTAASKRNDVSWVPYSSSKKAIAEYYTAADLFVHAGTAETFGLVSLEAQACGTRVVAVRNGGMDETLDGEQPLILAEDERPSSLSQAVGKALLLAETEEHRRARRQRVIHGFSWETSFRRLFAFYEHLCNHLPIESFH
ncbi:MAG: glycosyltransferase [Syntrophobacteraceae bacterium]